MCTKKLSFYIWNIFYSEYCTYEFFPLIHVTNVLIKVIRDSMTVMSIFYSEYCTYELFPLIHVTHGIIKVILESMTVTIAFLFCSFIKHK